MTTHSKIGASSAKRWMACPGSVKLSAGIESRSSEFAAEGTMAHGLAEDWLNCGLLPVGDWPGDMVEAVGIYVDWVTSLLGDHCELLLEHKFHLKQVHPDLFGTSDCIVWNPHTKTLIVGDYKHGQGVAVEVEDNPQLMYYALGALLETGYPAEKVQMTIVQPRCPHPEGPIRSRTIDALDLLEFADDLRKAALATEADDAPINPGSHCRWCPASGLPCPAVHAKAQEVAKTEFRTLPKTELAETLKWLPILEGWINSVREFAYQQAEHGADIPGWKLVEKVARRKWRFDDFDADALKALWVAAKLTDSDLYEKKMLSPAAVEKLLPKEQRIILNEMTTKESSGLALAPSEDRRPAVKVDAKSEFSAA